MGGNTSKEYKGDPVRIVLLGKTGSGKSSIGNVIFNRSNAFEVNNSPNSGTNICESKVYEVDGRTVQLIDTPGFFDTDPRSTDLSPAILKCFTECSPGPHAFLLVLKVEKFTEQEQAVVEMMLKYFSEEVLRYTTVVFTHGDNLADGMTIEKWVSQSTALKDLGQKCGGRCQVFDNKYWNNKKDQYRNNQVQVKKLLETVDETLRKNEGKCYTNETLQQVTLEIEQEAKEIKESSPNISEEDCREKAKASVYKKLLKVAGFAALGALLGGFLGMGGVTFFPAAPCLAKLAIGTVGGAGGAGVGGLFGELTGEAEVEIYFKNTKDKFELDIKTQKATPASEKSKFE